MATKKPTEKQIASAFSTYYEARTKRLELEKEAKAYSAMEKDAAEVLRAGIPPNESKAGVTRQTRTNRTVKWTDYTAAVLELLPKTKRPIAENLKEDYTTEKEVDVFKQAKDKNS